ncbi:MAG: exopolyphosphatase [Peptoanaerobacter stomatis]|uniref:exopolyphosphatase n=1 Tax=Peptoanaerobacter stomatis TaxID=796937 RepID=UPI003FA02A8F
MITINTINFNERYRLVTRSDFDGLVCAMILKELDILDEIKFVHPKDIQDKIIDITGRDILTNLPYDDRALLVFDHHNSEKLRNKELLNAENYIIDGNAPSAARVVYSYFIKEHKAKLDRISDELMREVDKADSAMYNENEILNPTRWTLLNFIMDARTGLGRFRNFRISNYDLMMKLIDFCLENNNIDDILELPDVKERVDLYFEQQELFKKQLNKIAKADKKVLVLDYRNEDIIYAGNRFLCYSIYPDIEISINVVKGKNDNIAIMIGKSIINRSSAFDIGQCCLSYGGGGHKNAGTCQVSANEADKVLAEIIEKINNN